MNREQNRACEKTTVPMITAVDVFCGVGGLTHGLEKAGIKVRLGIDIDPACVFPYEANNKAKFILKSVEDLQAKDVKRAFKSGTLTLLAGCAPCQTFSSYNQKADETDTRWWLLSHFSRLVKELSPDYVTMENVPGILKHEVFGCFVTDLENAGYHVNYGVVHCADYGIPQNRRRLVLLAAKSGPICLLPAVELGEHRISVRNAIADLPPLSAGEIDHEDPLHQCVALSDINLRRLSQSRPGGTWRDWDKNLVAMCHRKKTGKTYPSVYGRMSWDQPSPSITTQFFGFGNGRFGHPEQDRAISLREGAILQSFPRDYRFVPEGQTIVKKIVGRLIGNAVPVKLGEALGKSIIEHARKYLANKVNDAEELRHG